MKKVFVLVLVCWLLGVIGCQSWSQNPPIEAFVTKLADEAIIPAIREGLQNGVGNLDLQAGAQVINPTYEVSFEGLWVTGLTGKASVGVTGLSGQMMMGASGAPLSETTTVSSDVPPELLAAVERAEAAAAEAQDAASRASEDAKDAQDSAAAAQKK